MTRKTIYRCANCTFRTTDDNKLDGLPERGIFDRVGPGERMPDGQCPKCGAVVHAVEPDWKALLREIVNEYGTTGGPVTVRPLIDKVRSALLNE